MTIEKPNPKPPGLRPAAPPPPPPKQFDHDRESYVRRFHDCLDKLGEWQETTGFLHPTACKAELDRLRRYESKRESMEGWLVIKDHGDGNLLVENNSGERKTICYVCRESELTEARQEIEQLHRLLDEALEGWEDAAGCASNYLREKYQYDERIAAIKVKAVNQTAEGEGNHED